MARKDYVIQDPKCKILNLWEKRPCRGCGKICDFYDGEHYCYTCHLKGLDREYLEKLQKEWDGWADRSRKTFEEQQRRLHIDWEERQRTQKGLKHSS